MIPQDMVLEFYRAFNVDIGVTPDLSERTRDLLDLKFRLIDEEVSELSKALEIKDLVATADALGDLLYVTYGAAIAFGIDLDAVVEEIHRSNMTKLGEDGKSIHREDGKILKGPNFEEPKLLDVFLHQKGLV